MIIAQSFWRKAVVTAIAAGGFVLLYEATMLDSKYAVRRAAPDDASPPHPGDRLTFNATAYCKGITTTSGVAVQAGVVAADARLLPVGSVVELDGGNPRYDGIYTVMDTGPSVHGRQIDVYMWSCNEALQFGRKPVQLTVLRLGWNPRATRSSFFNRIFKPAGSDDTPEPLPSRPIPQLLPDGGAK